jgi:hypothetical protein
MPYFLERRWQEEETTIPNGTIMQFLIFRPLFRKSCIDGKGKDYPVYYAAA